MRKVTLKDDAVSPVIGVMLMLVVTVVIAAVVVGFSTGLAGDTSKTPMALFDVEYSEMDPFVHTMLFNLGFIHKGGDEIPVSHLQIVLEVDEPNGGGNDGFIYTYKHGDSFRIGNWGQQLFPDKPELNDPETMCQRVSVLGQEGKEDPIVSTGDVIDLFLINDKIGAENPSVFSSGQTLLWTVYHTPTNTVISKGELVVGA